MTPSSSRAVRMLTDEEIDAIAAHEYRAKRLPWLGFKKDAEGRYTLPYVTDAERALIRAVVATLSQETAAPAALPPQWGPDHPDWDAAHAREVAAALVQPEPAPLSHDMFARHQQLLDREAEAFNRAHASATPVAPAGEPSPQWRNELWDEIHRYATADRNAQRERARREIDKLLASPIPQQSAPAGGPVTKEAIADIVRQHLGDTYHCTRVWSAWQVGTMSEEDFEPADESSMAEEIADAILAATHPPAQAPQQVRVPLTQADIDWGMDCNIEDPSDEEAHAFERGVRFAEWKHGIVSQGAQDQEARNG